MRHVKRATFFILILFITVLFVPRLGARVTMRRDYTQFNKGVVYMLIKDKELSTRYMEEFFKEFPDPALRSGFINVIQNNSFEVTKEFGRYLAINHKSAPALVGIALSTTDMENSTSVGNLQRAVRLERNFSASYICLGMEYLKVKNYPMARNYINQAIARSRNIPEYKIILALLFLELGQPANVISTLKPLADQHPDNFHFNYYTAEAYYRLDQLDEMGKYITAAIEVKPGSNDAQLLQAKYLLSRKDYKKAKAALKRIRYSGYHEEYTKTFGHVLLELKDRQAKSFLDEVFVKKPWDKDINRLMGLYFLGQGEKEPVQGWLNRAILSGNNEEELKKVFPGGFKFPQYSFAPFFYVKSVHWLSENRLLVVAVKNSGERERIYILNIEDMKVENSLGYTGEFQNIYFSNDHEAMIFSTSDLEEGFVNLYAVSRAGKDYKVHLAYAKPLKMSGILVGFNSAGNLAYITDSDIRTRAFESPFSIASEMGEKEPVYPDYPYAIFQYNFMTNHLSVVKDITQMEVVPIETVKKYFLVYDGYEKNTRVRQLVDQGLRLELTSSKIVKIFFSNDMRSFGIYLSDLDNAFQAQLIDNDANKAFKVDETMFLGEGEYAELDVVDYDPRAMELMVITKDKDRKLIRFNYKTYLFTDLAEKVIQDYYDRKNRVLYVLTERSKKSNYTETTLAVISLRPFLKQIVDKRRNLKKILSVEPHGVRFSTNDGQVLLMDDGHEFQYTGPSFDGCVSAESPSKKHTAAFINGKLFIVGKNETDLLKSWAKKKDSKK